MEKIFSKNKKYQAKRKGLIHFIIGGLIILPVILFYIKQELVQETPWILLPFLAPLALIFWLYFDTSYQIKGDHLHYRSGFIRGKIRISTIREIQEGKTLWAGVKPALSSGGIIIKFGKYDEIYLAPESNSELIQDLIEINREISIFRV